ncbi:MAG TPA: L,D-transpeptidase family protein [Gemmatimonadales bacterium]|nr:L,D-transpeptidase family protein [Gemmatimonadales bacterium]
MVVPRLLLPALLLGTVLPSHQVPVSLPLQQLVDSARLPELRWPDFSDVQADLTLVYQKRDWKPLWFTGDTLSGPARAMIQVLNEAGNRGLDSTDYDAPWLSAQVHPASPPDSLQLARVELGLSVATARFARALRFGRVSPEAVHGTLHLPRDTLDLGGLLDSLAASREPNGLLRALEPPFIHYWLLMASLVRYRKLARDSTITALPPMPRHLRPGEPYAGVPELRRLLRVLGDDRDTVSDPSDSVYSGGLVDALRRFQMRQGFTPDGIIGDSTRDRLEHPFDQRIRQMELTLERWRWMPRHFSAPPIIVNIPAFRLYAFSSTDLDAKTVLAMNVVVGTAYKTETPVFADQLEYLVFAPYWDVTPTIAAREIKPDALKDPEFLARNRYELVQGEEVVPPWYENIELIGQGVRVRQEPGEHNALGLVKFIMPNDFQVYLHDTPAKSVFDRTRRDASHGCIRVGNPFGLAKFLLRDQPDWTDDRIRAAMHAGEPTTVRFRAPVPVYIIYGTVLATETGEVFFYPDIYGHDRTLDRLLRRGYPYPRVVARTTTRVTASP